MDNCKHFKKRMDSIYVKENMHIFITALQASITESAQKYCFLTSTKTHRLQIWTYVDTNKKLF